VKVILPTKHKPNQSENMTSEDLFAAQAINDNAVIEQIIERGRNYWRDAPLAQGYFLRRQGPPTQSYLLRRQPGITSELATALDLTDPSGAISQHNDPIEVATQMAAVQSEEVHAREEELHYESPEDQALSPPSPAIQSIGQVEDRGSVMEEVD
jgi:hypothetical protein